jgi:hypothetical protein
MKSIRILAVAGVLAVAGCGSGSQDAATTTVDTTATTAPAVTFTPTGSAALDDCIRSVLIAVADVDLTATDVDTQLSAVLTDDVMTPCDAITEEAVADAGMDLNQAMFLFLSALPPEVVDWMAQPTPFEKVEPSL